MIFVSICFADRGWDTDGQKARVRRTYLNRIKIPQVRDLTCSSPRTIQIVLRIPALRLFSFIQDKKSIDSRVRAIASHRENACIGTGSADLARWKWKTDGHSLRGLLSAKYGQSGRLGKPRREFLFREKSTLSSSWDRQGRIRDCYGIRLI